MSDIDPLMAVAFRSYSLYRKVLTPENWQTLENGLKNKERFTDLIRLAKVFICEADNVLAGAAYLVPSGNPTPVFQKDWCYIRMVGVNPEYQGNGIAKKLTLLCIESARATGEKTIALHTSEFMDAARHIYEAIGFSRLKEIDPIFGKRYWLYTLAL